MKATSLRSFTGPENTAPFAFVVPPRTGTAEEREVSGTRISFATVNAPSARKAGDAPAGVSSSPRKTIAAPNAPDPWVPDESLPARSEPARTITLPKSSFAPPEMRCALPHIFTSWG